MDQQSWWTGSRKATAWIYAAIAAVVLMLVVVATAQQNSQQRSDREHLACTIDRTLDFCSD